MIPCELDIKSNPFSDTTILTYEIELPPAGNKIRFNLLDYEDFTIPCVIDKITNETASNQIITQAKKMCVSLLPMEKSPSYIKDLLINSSTIRLNVGNTRSRSVYAEGRATRVHTLKIFGTDLINSELWFHILKFISQRNFSPQGTLVNI